MRKYIFIFFSVFCLDLNAQNFMPLKKNVDNGGYSFELPDGRSLFLVQDDEKQSTFAHLGNFGSAVKLKFYISDDETVRAYLTTLNHVDVIVIESHIYEATGLSANITNMTFLDIQEDQISKTAYSNSFFEGINSIEIIDGMIHIRVMEFDRHLPDHGSLCCKTSFFLDSSFEFIKINDTHCVVYKDGKFKSQEDCKCNEMQKPFAFEYQE